MKALEDWLGIVLFRRLPRGVVLTEAGRTYLGRVEDVLNRLSAATTDMRRFETSQVLTVSAMASFVARWLIPRLGNFTARHPHLDVRIVASTSLTDFAREEVDVAIRLGLGTYDGLSSELLLRETFFPVCSPALLANGRPLQKPADVAHYMLLHDEWEERIPDQIDWAHWLAAMRAPEVDAQRGLRFSFSHMTLQAAASGQGIALASSALVGDDLLTGRLIRPLGDAAVAGPYGFFVVCPQAQARSGKIIAFREWAFEELASA